MVERNIEHDPEYTMNGAPGGVSNSSRHLEAISNFYGCVVAAQKEAMEERKAYKAALEEMQKDATGDLKGKVSELQDKLQKMSEKDYS